MKYNHRPWSTPIVIASGLVIVVSGVMLFFHLGEDLIKAAHEWIGIVMAGGILLHIHFHWRSFKQYFKKPVGFTVIALILLASTVLITASGNNEPHPAKQLVEQYSSKSLNQIASFENRPLEQIIIDLEIEKITVESPNLSLQEIATANSVHIFDLLPLIFSAR